LGLFLFVFGGTGVWTWLCTCKAGILLFEPCLQYGYFINGVLVTMYLGWPHILSLLISAFKVARIIGMSHRIWLRYFYWLKKIGQVGCDGTYL
jgi:hypothetical protein